MVQFSFAFSPFFLLTMVGNGSLENALALEGAYTGFVKTGSSGNEYGTSVSWDWHDSLLQCYPGLADGIQVAAWAMHGLCMGWLNRLTAKFTRDNIEFDWAICDGAQVLLDIVVCSRALVPLCTMLSLYGHCLLGLCMVIRSNRVRYFQVPHWMMHGLSSRRNE